MANIEIPGETKPPEPTQGDVRIRRVVTAIDASGNTFSECHAETFVGGRWVADDPKSLANSGPEADAWANRYCGAIEAERDQCRLDLAAATNSLTAMTAERDALIERLAAMENHPDVREAKKQKLIEEARRAIDEAAQRKREAEETLAQFEEEP